MATIRLYQNRINPLVLPVILADKLGYFQKFEVPVALEIADNFEFGGKNRFLDNQVDAMMGDLTFFFDYLVSGKDAIVTSTLTRTIKLVGRQELESYENLKVGVARKGLFPFFMAHDLAKVLTNPEIVWIDNTYERIEALKNGEIDALVAIEPFIHDVLTQLPTKLIWSSQDSDKNMVMWCFDKAFYQRNPQLVKRFHYALEAAMEDFNQLTADEKEAQAKKIANYTPEAAANMRHFHFEASHNYAEKDFNLLADFLYQEKKLPKKLNAKEYIAPIFKDTY